MQFLMISFFLLEGCVWGLEMRRNCGKLINRSCMTELFKSDLDLISEALGAQCRGTLADRTNIYKLCTHFCLVRRLFTFSIFYQHAGLWFFLFVPIQHKSAASHLGEMLWRINVNVMRENTVCKKLVFLVYDVLAEWQSARKRLGGQSSKPTPDLVWQSVLEPERPSSKWRVSVANSSTETKIP